MHQPNSSWSSSSPLNKALSIVLMLAILAAIGAIVYLAVTPHAGEKFTEFYILGPEGKADNYPRKLTAGEESSVLLGIVNHEYAEVNYRVEVVIGETKVTDIGPIVLANQGKWEKKVSFTPVKAGNNQKVEFVLYKEGQDNAYLTLNLWIDVQDP